LIEHVVAHLKTAPVSTLNGDRVYPDVAPEKLSTSIIVNQISGPAPFERETTGRVRSWVSTFQIYIRTNTRRETGAIKGAVIQSLDNLSGIINGAPFDRALLDNGRDDYESDERRFLSSLTFTIYHP